MNREFSLRHFLGFLTDMNRRLGRDLTTEEVEACRDIYMSSEVGWKKTKQAMRRAVRGVSKGNEK